VSEKLTAPRWGMVIDLNRCVGCQTCTIACKHSNDTSPGVQWRQVLDVEHGTFPDVQREFLVVGCQHCAEPSCVPVCPTGATRQRTDGLVTMDYDVCIGCGYCAVACPYQARTIQEHAVAHDERIGVAQKCTFCIERVDEGLEQGATPGIDLDYTPACAASCVAEAINFGDCNDPGSKVSRLAAGNRSFQMHAELGNDPQIKYLYEVPAVPGRDSAEGDSTESSLGDPANRLVGKRQRFWDFRAAMNFMLGGAGSGMAFLSMIGHFRWDWSEPLLLNLFVTAGVLMAIGLFFVFMEIGRKARFLKVLLRPQSSWMTRETYFVAVFYPALLADWFWPRPWLHAAIGIAAFGFLISQARILYAGKGIPAWRAPLIPWLIVLSGLLEGTGLLLLIFTVIPNLTVINTEMYALTAALAVTTGILWIAYGLTAQRSGMPPLARREINRIAPFVTVLGHLMPVIALLIIAYPGDLLIPRSFTLFIGGSGALVGGLLWKFTIVTRASFEQGFALPKLPQRGSGSRAAPFRSGFSNA
jgi:phenylacetyl-CoA:acceptor oxidoreductase subunit 1